MSSLPTPDDVVKYPVLRYFRFDHLPPRLQEMSRNFAETAAAIVLLARDSTDAEQVNLSLTLLLQSKDAAVRSLVP